MHKVWMMYNPARAGVALVAFLAILAFTIHFILLSSDYFNWIEGPPKAAAVPMSLEAPTGPASGLV
jgi:light-harvesting complex 1 alpha chain